MGAEKSQPKKGEQARFTDKELKSVQQVFLQLSKEHDIKKGVIESSQNLKNFLLFNEEISQSFYNWLTHLAQLDPNNKNKKIHFELFLAAVEYLTKSKNNYLYEGFNRKKLNSLEILCIIMFFSKEWSTISLDKAKLTKQNCHSMLQYVLSIFGVESNTIIDTILHNVFKHEDNPEEINAEQFFFKVGKVLQYVNRTIIEYWNNYIYHGIKQVQYPRFMEQSEILSDEYLPLLYINNSSVQSAKGLYLLYSSSKSGVSFNRLSFAILGYNAPTLILIKHKENDKENNTSTQHIIGAYHHEQWYNQLKYQGDSQSYLFSLQPQYKTLHSYDGAGSSNYAYLNNRQIDRSKYKVGLGFGGNEDYNSYRLWIDDDIQANSYVKSEDKTFGHGSLINNRQMTKLDVRTLEIWGIGSEENLQAQLEHRENERKEIEKMRKVDKKALWDNGFNQQMLFGKLTAHKDQLQQEVKRDDD